MGDVFNPFQLFIGAMIPAAVLRNPDLSPFAKLVFARLAQFAGRQGKAWPSDQTLGREVGLGDRQARRCVAELERYGLIRRVSRAGHSNLFEFLWHAIYEEGRTEMTGLPSAQQGQDRQALPPVVPAQNGKEAAHDAVGTVSKTAEPVHQEKGPASDPQHDQTRLIPGFSIPVPAAMQGSKPIDPEQIFLSRLRQRHGDTVPSPALVQCIAGELKNWRDWEDFLVFDERQTTAPELLKNPAGHYRQLVRKFYAARAQKREGNCVNNS